MPDDEQDPIKKMLARNFRLLLRNIVPRIRIIMEQFIVLLVFLVADSLIFRIFSLLSKSDNVDNSFVNLILEGVQYCSITAIGFYFIMSTISGLTLIPKGKIGGKDDEDKEDW
jgi:hypothetical protein